MRILSTAASLAVLIHSATGAAQTIPGGLGWHALPNTRLADVCAASNGFPEVSGNTGCTSIYIAWSGGAFDTAGNRLLIWGGGHGDYAGNEVYALDLDTLTLDRLNDPSTPVRDGCSSGSVYADGKPVSRHSYNHLAYLPNQNAMFAFGGSRWQCGFLGNDTWTLNLSDLSWAKKSDVSLSGSPGFGLAVAYDPNNGLVYMQDYFNLYAYDPASDRWARRNSSDGVGATTAAVVDPVRKLYISSSGTTLRWYDISSPTAMVQQQSAPTTGCSGMLGDERVGLEYDPVQDRIVGWNGGDTVYILDVDSRSCTTVSYPGGPAAPSQGTYGRFRYAPALNLFVVCNDVSQNCHALRLTTDTPTVLRAPSNLSVE